VSIATQSVLPHLAHWRLARSPFRGQSGGARYVPTSVQDEALARLRFLADSRKRLGWVVGPEGAGKSTVLDEFARQERLHGALATRIGAVGLEPDDLLDRIARAWGVVIESTTTTRERWVAVFDKLDELRICRQQATLLVDDIDDAQPELLNVLTRLLLDDRTSRWPLVLVMAGRPEAIRSLPMRLLGLVELRIDVSPWDVTDTETFIARALQAAGREKPAFSREALERLHELSDGVARHIEQLADLSLVAAAAMSLPIVDLHTVETVHAELASC